MTIPPEYKPSGYILFEEPDDPKNLKKDGKCIYMYVTARTFQRMQLLKRKMKAKSWNDFCKTILKSFSKRSF